MKKRLLQVIAFVCVTVTSFLQCSCGKKNDSGNNLDAENIRAEHKVTNSLHKGVENIPDTGKPFIVDGASEYKIVATIKMPLPKLRDSFLLTLTAQQALRWK